MWQYVDTWSTESATLFSPFFCSFWLVDICTNPESGNHIGKSTHGGCRALTTLLISASFLVDKSATIQSGNHIGKSASGGCRDCLTHGIMCLAQNGSVVKADYCQGPIAPPPGSSTATLTSSTCQGAACWNLVQHICSAFSCGFWRWSTVGSQYKALQQSQQLSIGIARHDLSTPVSAALL